MPGTSDVVRDGTAGAPTVAITALNAGTYQADFAAALAEEYRSDTAFAILAAPVAGTSSAKLIAREPGRWAENVRVQVRPASRAPVNATAALAAGATVIPVTSAANFYRGGTIQIQTVPAAGANAGHVMDVRYATIATIAGNSLTIVAPAVALPAYATAAETWISMAEVDILVMWGALVERFSGSWRYFDTAALPPGWSVVERRTSTLRTQSGWRCTSVQRSCASTHWPMPPAAVFPTPYNAASPLDTHPTTADGQPTALGPEPPLARDTPDLVPGFPEYVGNPGAGPGTRTGLAALLDEESISLVTIPGITDQRVQAALIDHAEELKYRFAVLDAPPGATIAQVRAHRGHYDSEYAAIYYPWIQIARPDTGELIYVPPSGTVLGIYGRSDGERGVHKAPANEVTRNAIDLETRVAMGEQEVLNPEGINVIRDFRVHNRGIRVWGARTISSDPEWTYINVRRLFIFIEASIDHGTQWVVFEPNNQDLWSRVKRTIETFLDAQWRAGALFGAKAEDAYFVKCDRSTMTLDDIANGRLVVEIGIAPTRPAEFVIFRIGQFTPTRPPTEGAETWPRSDRTV